MRSGCLQMAEQSSDSRWKRIAVAVSESGIKERSLYRLVAQGKVPSKKTDHGTLVDVDAAKALAASKAAARRPSAAPPATNGGRQAAADGGTTDDGELAARVIARREDGASAIEIVKELRHPPHRVPHILPYCRPPPHVRAPPRQA